MFKNIIDNYLINIGHGLHLDSYSEFSISQRRPCPQPSELLRVAMMLLLGGNHVKSLIKFLVTHLVKSLVKYLVKYLVKSLVKSLVKFLAKSLVKSLDTSLDIT